jgi:2-polyprenyl-3-methyl-5-hydroxy-6-metoxy-1,4-benzoquinol methylase
MQAAHQNLEKSENKIVKDVIQAKSKYSPKFENGVFYDSFMENAFCRTVSDVNNIGKNLKVIEFGCFTGIVSASMQRLGHQVVASDVDFVLSDPANRAFFEAEHITTVPHDLSSSQPLPLPTEGFDLIIFTEVLEHLNFNPLPLISEFNRILRTNGFIYVATPNLASIYNRLCLAKGKSFMNPVEHLRWNLTPNSGMSVGLHWREYTKNELIDIFAEYGFSLNHHYYTHLAVNRSSYFRKHLISLMYKVIPSLLPAQVAIFRKN